MPFYKRFMMSVEKKFFDAITAKTDLNSSGEAIYKELIYNRYEDVIIDTFDIYCKYMGEDIVKKEIKEFIKYGAKSFYIWKMAEEFMEYIKTTDIKKNKKAIDMLMFQWKQIKILSLDENIRKRVFKWNSHFKLSQNAYIKKLSFSPYIKNIANSNTTYTLIYKSSLDYKVYHFEITEFLYFYLNKLKLNTPINSLRLTSKKFNQNVAKVKKTVEPTLQKFAKNGIITIKSL